MIHYVAQHHSSRAESLTRLLRSLPGVPVTICTDPDPKGRRSAWRTYRACLTDPPPSATHIVVLQDDTECVPGFPTAAVAAAAAKPDSLVSFFHGPQPATVKRTIWRACENREPFWLKDAGRFVPTVALCWPVNLAAEFLTWATDVRKVRPDFLGDDAIVGEWAGRAEVAAWVTAPSLVEHPDDVPSLTRTHVNQKRTAVVLAGHADEWVSLLPR